MTNRPATLTTAFLLVCTSLVSVQRAAAQAAPAPPPPRAVSPATAPFDPAVTTGTLPNGLKYYIRHNGRPEKRVLMQLAVKAGSIDEADDQQGLAHFLEHMAFNGTRTSSRGADRDARVDRRADGPARQRLHAFDETIYMFELPDRQAGGSSRRGCRRWRTSAAACPSTRRRSTRSAAS